MKPAQLEVRSFIEEAWAAFRAQDVKAAATAFHPDFHMFPHTGDLRTEGGVDRARIEAYFDAGAFNRTTLRHLRVDVYGDAALITGYTVGRMASTSDYTEDGTWRYTAMLTKEDGNWQIVHNHFSPLSPPHERRAR